ncbi:MAG: sulfatase, partial [Cyclobacteriaceae bacterium]
MRLFFIILLTITPFLLQAQNLKNTQPNILLILVDDLGYGDLSAMDAQDLKTPHIDKIFSEGIKFTQFYANSSVCSPSRAALLTGRYPDMAGVPGVIRQRDNDSWGYLTPGITTLPMVLKDAGYTTGMVGKWHLGLESPNKPTEKGFDYFKGFLADMMDDYYTHLRGKVNWMRENIKEINPEGHATDLFTDWSIDYLQKHRDSEQPFFLYLAYNAPHDPIQPPQEWLDKVMKREKGIEKERAGIVALIEHMDAGIGRLMQSLQDNDLAENTLVIFTSDNGGSLHRKANNGPLRAGKQDMYEGGIRVPAAISWPGKIKPAVNHNLVVLMDLFPTLCTMAGAAEPAKVDGISILPLLQGENQVTDDRTVFFMRREGFKYNGLAYYAVRKGDYKLVQNTPYEPFQFFNIARDMGEQNPLPQDCEPCKQMKRELEHHINRSGAIPWKP